jgi:arabinose-5-phosphate isomerase
VEQKLLGRSRRRVRELRAASKARRAGSATVCRTTAGNFEEGIATMPTALSLKDETEGGLASARRVLALERAGIDALSRALDQSFIDALDVLGAVRGRVIVTGMGKSGHIARKVAATLASTGTPASFVHPAEASHGDLGMIAGDDAVIAFSNSGETPELADLVTYCKRFEIPLIGVTGRAGSTLAEAADVALLLPESPEACPMGLAPTTSTTVMLALGDALAVAMLEHKGFSADDFHVLHPGGKLGRRLLRVADIMHTGEAVPLVRPDTPMAEALIMMTAKSFGCVGIVGAGGTLDGIITDGDLRRHIADDFLRMSAGEMMTGRPKAIRPDALASEALAVMNGRSITNLFVVEDGRAVGILHVHDCLRAGVA